MKDQKRWLAVLLASSMAMVSFSPAAVRAAADTEIRAEAVREAGEEIVTGDLLASFDFNEEASNGIFMGGNAQAQIQGDCRLQERDAENRKALYLNGNGAWLNVKRKDGSSLLTGMDEVTVSFDVKPEVTGTTWPFYAAPNTNAQTYQREYYLGGFIKDGNLKVERYLNGRTQYLDNIPTGSDWKHVDIVFAAAATRVYVEGSLEKSVYGVVDLPKILGDGSIFQIGKANWEGGEYFKGWLDNFAVYGRKLTAEERALEIAKENLVIADAGSIKGNISLPEELQAEGSGEKVTVTWKSSDPSVITDTPQGKKAAGVVKRPEAGSEAVNVTLTALLSCGKAQVTKNILVTVQPMAEVDTDYTAGYLWTSFGESGGYEKIFLGYSEDGLNWEHLNKNAGGTAQPVLTNDAKGSDLGVRDPHLIRSAEGDKYWILGTDLHAEGSGEGGSGWNQLSASQNLVVWESEDLVNWSEPRLVYAGFENAGCVWAPEAIYDEETGDYLVYWSARDRSLAGTEQNALRVYVCRTRDFYSFSEPKVWLSEDQDSGKEVNIIDSTLVQDGETFYRFSTSDWNTVIDKSSVLDSEDVLDVRQNETKSTPKGSWERIVTRSGSSAAGFDGREGFTVYQLPDGRWCAMGDNQGYRAFVTDDLSSGKFTAVKATFDTKFRHGTVIRLSREEEDRILEAYGNDAGAREPVLEYSFEGDLGKKVMSDTGAGDEKKDDGVLYGNAKVVYDEERESNVLELDGSSSSYGEFPKGFFDGRDVMSISMDIKSQMSSGNFFTFAYGKDSTVYDFLRIRGTDVRNAITVKSWNEEKTISGTGADAGEWQKAVLVINGGNMKLYLDGKLAGENTDTGITTSDLGEGLLAYLGKSFYSEDAYFKGCFDNIRVYNRMLTSDEILEDVIDTAELVKSAVTGTAPDHDTAVTYRGTDGHTAVYTAFDKKERVIQPYVRRNADVTKLPVSFSLLTEDVEVTVSGKAFTNGSEMDLSKEKEVTFRIRGREETWMVRPAILCANPVLPGQYADPDIDFFEGRYWIFPTTDGYPGWSGTQFHAWSSEDMVNWEEEGIIMELANDNPGENEKGIPIASSPWAVRGSAWAPAIEKKNGKYYFYYCGKDLNGTSSIGVAVADHPAGPYQDKGELLVSKEMCDAAGVPMGQAIDPSVFTEEDGTSYLLFGNGSAAIAELNEDMMSIKEGTLRQISGLRDFRESVAVIRANGKYHWTWSCDDANSPNYHVNYGVTDSLFTPEGKCEVKCTKEWFLGKKESLGILGSAHQSMLHIVDQNGQDRYFMAYHRFYTPVNIFTSGDGLGVHRETCIDEIFFDEEGQMVITPTLEGVDAVYAKGGKPAPADKTNRQTVIGAAGEEKEELYTRESWEIFENALNAAKEILEKAEAAQEELDEAIKRLTDARAGLMKKEEKPGDKPADQPTDKPEDRPADQPVKAEVKNYAGMIFTAGGLEYKVTKDDGKVREACVTGLQNRKLKKLVIPKTAICKQWNVAFQVTAVEKKAFQGASARQAVIGDQVVKIGASAFANCRKLKSLVIGKSVKEVASRAFYGCKMLRKITIKGKALKTVKKNSFKKISARAQIKVPKGKKKLYKKILKGKISKGIKLK